MARRRRRSRYSMRFNPYRRRLNRRRRRRRNTGVMGKINTTSLMYGAGGGAIAGILLTAGAGAARGIPAGPAMPKNALVGALFGAVGSMLGKSPVGSALIGALAAGTGIYVVNVMKAAAAPDAGVAGLGLNVQQAIAGLGEYVSPSQRYDGGDLGEYVTPGAFLEGMGQVFEGNDLLPPQGIRSPFFPGMASRARMPISWKCKSC